MMPAIYGNSSSYEDNYEFNTPVASLKEGLPVSDLLNKHEAEFEVRPDEDESFGGINSAEACFDFDKLEKLINLDLIEVDETEDGDDITPFDKYRRKMHNLREDGKVMKYVVKQGVGCLVPDNSLVYIRYQAYSEYAEVPFDSTLCQCGGEADLPMPFNLGKGEVLPGLREALLSMRKGEKAQFLVHPDLAYKELGCAPRIPPDATIFFVVEVDRFVDCADIHETNDDLSMEERSQFCNVFKIAKAHHVLANDLFKRENFSAAANKYRQVINMMHNARLANEEEENDRNRFLIKNYTNACICYHKLKNHKRVCLMAADAVTVSDKLAFANYKLIYFWGVSKTILGDYEGARKHLLSAQRLKPNDPDIANALKELNRKKADALQNEKIMATKAFGFQPPQAKIKEIDEAEEKLRLNISSQLMEFISNTSKDTLTLRDLFTLEEEKIILHLARDLGLYPRVVDGDRRFIHIKKPADM